MVQRGGGVSQRAGCMYFYLRMDSADQEEPVQCVLKQSRQSKDFELRASARRRKASPY